MEYKFQFATSPAFPPTPTAAPAPLTYQLHAFTEYQYEGNPSLQGWGGQGSWLLELELATN